MTRNHSSVFGGAPVLDDDTLAGLAALSGDDDPDLICELIELFLEDAVGRLRSMSSALQKGDPMPIAQAAHALKSASASVGALAFSGKCKQIEQVAREEGPVEELVTACHEMFEEVREAMQAYRSSQA